MQKKRIAIFASGTGSNALNLIRYFSENQAVDVALVLSNNAAAPIVESARALGVETKVLSNTSVANGALLIETCREFGADWIVLAGYLRLIPVSFIQAYEGKIINLHPSLLPNYGGKGMYGRNVHEAVLANGETETGITVHFVNEEFDKGRIIAQFHCAIEPSDTVSDVEQKIRYLEHSYLPTVVEHTILNAHHG